MSRTVSALITTTAGVTLALTLGTAPALAADGAAVYTAQKCSMCHAIAGKGNKANPLDGIGAKLSAADTKAWIVTPVEMTAKAKSTKKPPMPAKYGKLPAADIDALVEYLQSLK